MVSNRAVFAVGVLPGLVVLVLVGVVAGCLVLDAMATDAQRATYVSERGVVSGSIGALVGLCGAAILAFRTLGVRPDEKSVYYYAGIDNAFGTKAPPIISGLPGVTNFSWRKDSR